MPVYTTGVESPWVCHRIVIYLAQRAQRAQRGVVGWDGRLMSATLPTSCFLLPTSLARTEGAEGTEPYCWLVWSIGVYLCDMLIWLTQRRGDAEFPTPRPHLLPRAHTPPSAYPMASRGDSTLRLPSQPAWNDARGGVHAEDTHPPSVIP